MNKLVVFVGPPQDLDCPLCGKGLRVYNNGLMHAEPVCEAWDQHDAVEFLQLVNAALAAGKGPPS